MLCGEKPILYQTIDEVCVKEEHIVSPALIKQQDKDYFTEAVSKVNSLHDILCQKVWYSNCIPFLLSKSQNAF